MLMQMSAEAMSSWVGRRESSLADGAKVQRLAIVTAAIAASWGQFCNIVLEVVVV